MKGTDGKPLNIVQEIAAYDYTTFGMCLLQDKNGTIVKLLKKNHIHDGAESVTQAIFRKWLTSDAPTRTYQHLIECLRQSELGALAELIRLNKSCSPCYPNSYASYLRRLYTGTNFKSNSQSWTGNVLLPKCEYIELAIIENKGLRQGDREERMVRLAQQGRIETILNHKEPIDLDKLFLISPLVELSPPRVLLIEGAPGVGKSTLARYICQQWANRASFLAQFNIVVIVYLREEAIQNATTLADILPTRRVEMSQMTASKMQSSDGANVLFVFDGWDEFPQDLQIESLVSRIIRQPEMLSLDQSTVLITSRPVSSGNLLDIADRRVEILGFTPHKIREYIKNALNGNSTHIQKLVQHLEEHPVIEGYCYVPLHVAILVHVFMTYSKDLPTTLHELFCKLVLCCIVREQKTHDRSKRDFSKVFSLNDFPDDLKTKLNDLCVLAYEGVMQNRVVFYQKNLQDYHLPDNLPPLGLLLAVEGLMLNFSTSLSYNFLHLSVQELLAAYHISHMDSTRQKEVFERMFGSSRFQAVLHYYSGFTKLADLTIRDFISTYSRKQSKIDDLLPLFHCFYEAQDPSLCELVGSRFENTIELHDRWSPVDYLAVGYLINSLLLISSSDDKIFLLKINDEFNDHKLKLLFLELSKWSTADTPFSSTRKLKIQFTGTTITDEKAMLIASLTEKMSCISKLVLKMRQSKIDDGAIIHIAQALQKINCSLTLLQIDDEISPADHRCNEHDASALKKMCEMNKSLTHLSLSGSSFSCYIFQGLQHSATITYLRYTNTRANCTGDTAQALTTMLQVNKTLTHLDLSENHNYGDSGAYCVCQGLQHNTTLVYLNLSSTEITDKGAEYIAQAIESNCSLQELKLSENRITPNGFACIDESLKANTNSRLKITK